jgi:hypothetical protein
VNANIQTEALFACEKHECLLSNLSRAIEVLVIAQAAHLTASKFGGPRASGFNEDLAMAGARWKLARKALVQHVLEHGC